MLYVGIPIYVMLAFLLSYVVIPIELCWHSYIHYVSIPIELCWHSHRRYVGIPKEVKQLMLYIVYIIINHSDKIGMHTQCNI